MRYMPPYSTAQSERCRAHRTRREAGHCISFLPISSQGPEYTAVRSVQMHRASALAETVTIWGARRLTRAGRYLASPLGLPDSIGRICCCHHHLPGVQASGQLERSRVVSRTHGVRSPSVRTCTITVTRNGRASTGTTRSAAPPAPMVEFPTSASRDCARAHAQSDERLPRAQVESPTSGTCSRAQSRSSWPPRALDPDAHCGM